MQTGTSAAAPLPPAKPTFIFRPASILQRLRPEDHFPRPQPLQVELGSGDGSFMAEYAALHPEVNFLGVERLLGRLRKLDRKGLRRGLSNLRLLRCEARYVTEYLLSPGSIAALHVYFPDPWPKRKHRKNRLVNQEFALAAQKALAPGGTIYLRTDDEDYFNQMIEVFSAATAFQQVETPLELSRVVTDFERNFLARGVVTRRAAYRVKDSPV